jgi:hypothetical protein
MAIFYYFFPFRMEFSELRRGRPFIGVEFARLLSFQQIRLAAIAIYTFVSKNDFHHHQATQLVLLRGFSFF